MRFILVSVEDKDNTKPIDIPDEIVVSSDIQEPINQEPIISEKQNTTLKDKSPSQKTKTHQTSRIYGR